jgi:hypothetical protein
MSRSHVRHLPVSDDIGLVGMRDITDVCRALIDPGPHRRSCGEVHTRPAHPRNRPAPGIRRSCSGSHHCSHHRGGPRRGRRAAGRRRAGGRHAYMATAHRPGRPHPTRHLARRPARWRASRCRRRRPSGARGLVSSEVVRGEPAFDSGMRPEGLITAVCPARSSPARISPGRSGTGAGPVPARWWSGVDGSAGPAVEAQ